ncbi:MAG: helix-turn-helix domain-containing protein [Paludibacter sp.]|jgi:ligand-binding sensor domain-containing protein/AraC-like DNA-binding protein|nr:helix-turn-helix domain-containing protein [Paludibacter sp.]
MKIRLFFTLINCFILANLFANENFYFRRIAVENGLQQNTVLCMAQDQQGFLWFGTKDGLNRYDGNNFMIFRHNAADSESIGNSFIRCIAIDSVNNLWLGTDDGVYVLDSKTLKFTAFDKTDKNGERLREVNDIKFAANGDVWFAAQRIFSYRPAQSEKMISYHTVLPAHTLCCGQAGDIYIGTPNGLLLYDAANDSLKTTALTGDDIYCLFYDYYNRLIAGTANAGVKILNTATGETELLDSREPYKSLFVRSIMRHSSGDLWFGTESGIFIYSKNSGEFINITHSVSNPYSLSDNAVYSLAEDAEGGVWAGTYFGGVNYLSPANTSFEKFYASDSKNTLQSERIREFQQDKYGRIWIGTEDHGLYCYTPADKKFVNFMPAATTQSLSYHNIHGLLADGDNLWVGTFTHGLDRIDLRTMRVAEHYQKTENPRSLCDNSVFAIFRDHSQNLWLGTIQGVCRYNPQENNFTKIDFTESNFIYDITETSDGNLWFAGYGSGLYRYNIRTGEWKHFRHNAADSRSIPHNKVISLFEDSRKNLWLATEGNGIARYNAADESFTTFNSANGLPNDVVYEILEDDRQNLWFSSNNGLCCFNLDNQNITTYLTGNQFNYKSGFRAADGKMYFGSINGFVAFYPASFTRNNFLPPVVITRIRLFNKDLTLSKKIRLKYNQSSLSIDFAALSYVSPEKNRYAYQLVGFDENPIFAQGKTTATYANLPAGKYIFQVRGANNDDLWNDIAATVEIVISPPFYRSWVAYIIYFLLFCGAAFLAIRFRLFWQKIREKLKRKKNSSIIDNSRLYEFISAQNATDAQLSPIDAQFLNKAIELVHNNLSESAFSIDTLANRLFMSRSTLHRRIKKITGLTPNDFILMMRLEKSIEYLNEDKYSIAEISTMVGFETPSYFSKSFKKRYGKSPISYKREIKG